MAGQGAIDPASIAVLLCDADGSLFPSEEPAFEASAQVVNRFMAEAGLPDRFGAEELRLATTGMNFRRTIVELARARGASIERSSLERWVAEERRSVTAHLRDSLVPNPWVRDALVELSARFELAVVSSSALRRIDACLEVTGLSGLFGAAARFSAEDSLPEPRSKPDPAIYVHATERLGIEPAAGLAVEDSAPGVASAVVAGITTVGNVAFVPAGERTERAEELRAAGATDVIASWSELDWLLSLSPSRRPRLSPALSGAA